MTLGARRHRYVAAGAIGQPGGERKVEGQTQGIEIGAAVTALTGQELGGQIVERADQPAGAGYAGDAIEPGRAEIGEAGPAVRTDAGCSAA